MRRGDSLVTTITMATATTAAPIMVGVMAGEMAGTVGVTGKRTVSAARLGTKRGRKSQRRQVQINEGASYNFSVYRLV